MSRRHRIASSIVIATACLGGTARAGDPDPWLGRDKALHFGVSTILASGAYGASALVFESRTARAATGALVSLSLGTAKELYDLTGRGDPSWKDFTWDVIGTAVGVSLALLIDYAVRGDRTPVHTGTRQALLAW